MDFINDYLETYFEEVEPIDFYRAVFPPGELEQKGVYENGKYCGIAVEVTNHKKKNGTPIVKRYSITDGLEQLPELLQSDNFIIVSPISYAGKSRVSENVRYIYGIAVDLDGIEEKAQLNDLIHQMQHVDFLPNATYIVASGTGVHLYYLFEQPIPCFKNVTKQLATLKKALTRKIWNGYVTSLTDCVQYESLFQGFRLVGGVTKNGHRTRVYQVGERVTIEYLNEFVQESERVTTVVYKSKLTKAKAKELYPEWYEKRITKKQPKGVWTCKTDLYEWWKRQILSGATVGHRYYCLMCLAIYAKKSGVEREQLEKDSFELLEYMESLTDREDNHFTESDILQALELYNDNYFTFPRDTISQLTDIEIKANKRNHRKQSLHLKIARNTLDILNEENGKALQGRPTKQKQVEEWQQAHPNGTITECSKQTGITRATIYKYWN